MGKVLYGIDSTMSNRQARKSLPKGCQTLGHLTEDWKLLFKNSKKNQCYSEIYDVGPLLVLLPILKMRTDEELKVWVSKT